jgi:hypothetical protein
MSDLNSAAEMSDSNLATSSDKNANATSERRPSTDRRPSADHRLSVEKHLSAEEGSGDGRSPRVPFDSNKTIERSMSDATILVQQLQDPHRSVQSLGFSLDFDLDFDFDCGFTGF